MPENNNIVIILAMGIVLILREIFGGFLMPALRAKMGGKRGGVSEDSEVAVLQNTLAGVVSKVTELDGKLDEVRLSQRSMASAQDNLGQNTRETLEEVRRCHSRLDMHTSDGHGRPALAGVVGYIPTEKSA